MQYSPLVITGYFIGLSALTHVGTSSSNCFRSNPKKKHAEYRSFPLLLITRCTVGTRKLFVCRMEQSTILATKELGLDLLCCNSHSYRALPKESKPHFQHPDIHTCGHRPSTVRSSYSSLTKVMNEGYESASWSLFTKLTESETSSFLGFRNYLHPTQNAKINHPIPATHRDEPRHRCRRQRPY